MITWIRESFWLRGWNTHDHSMESGISHGVRPTTSPTPHHVIRPTSLPPILSRSHRLVLSSLKYHFLISTCLTNVMPPRLHNVASDDSSYLRSPAHRQHRPLASTSLETSACTHTGNGDCACRDLHRELQYHRTVPACSPPIS